MNYSQCVRYIESLMPGSLTPCLERMQAFLLRNGDLVGKPCFHVGGTNGKGSTTVILEAALHKGFGLKVGRFSGPHILNWNERISINGESISQEEFAASLTTVRSLSEDFARRNDFDELSWFEILLATALLHFNQKNVDCIVLEVGLGGRFDATNALPESDVVSTIITNIELDHTHILGDTVEKIASEKAGIMKPGCWVTTQAKGAGKQVLIEKAEEKQAPIFCLDSNIDAAKKFVDDWLSVKGGRIKTDEILDCLSLPGKHQRLNALSALVSITKAKSSRFSLSPLLDEDSGKRLCEAFAKIYWPGRLQKISAGPQFQNMTILLDAAHNPNGAEILARALSEMKISKTCFILGFFSNKDVPSFLARMLDFEASAGRVIAYQAASHRQTIAKDEILRLCSSLRPDFETIQVDTMEEALQKASECHELGFSVVATGSFAVLKDVMKELGWSSVEHARIVNQGSKSAKTL